MDVSWLPPKSPNGPITGYMLGISPPVPPIEKTLLGHIEKDTVESEFLPNVTYSFWVRKSHFVFSFIDLEKYFLVKDGLRLDAIGRWQLIQIN